ncbi:MAG: argininosuccinate lyase [bacterium]
MAEKLWSGRFKDDMSRSVEKFTSSIDFDKRLYKEDVIGSIAWANALKRAKVITSAEAAKIIKGLKAISVGIEKGSIKLKKELEDIHMNIESLLINKIGDAGKRLHTGRSRNDQVATDLRLYLKEEIKSILKEISALERTLIKLAEDNISVIMPGYTHMQQAQPILFSHYIMAYFEMLERDKARFRDCLERIDVMPLGSGALAGSAYPIDRTVLAEDLGFKNISQNSLDAVSDRDFVAEILFCISLAMMHLSRFCSELIPWSSSDYGFVEIGDAYTTGSSLMPQKKNPDVAELVRGKTGRVYGDLISILTVMKGLSLTYNRDLQEDKEPLFNSIDTLKASLGIFSEMLSSMKINAKAMKDAVKSTVIATDLADYLVGKGIPFRAAHNIAGKIVAYCEKTKKDISSLSVWEFRKFSDKICEDVYGAITLEKSIEARNVIGGTASRQVLRAIANAKKRV